MSAGGSQAVQAVQAVLSGVWASKQTDRRALKAGRHAAGCRGERAVCAELSKLALVGVQHLDDRRVRADTTGRANLDHLVIGPAGVFVVDAKNWAGQLEVRANHLLQDGVPRDERLIALTWLTSRVEDVLIAAGYEIRPRAMVCFATAQPALAPAVGITVLTDVAQIARHLADRPRVLTAEQVHALTELLAHAFPPYAVDPDELTEAEGLLFPEDDVRHAGLREALDRPVEQWMAWLHPEQALSVRRSFAGPARIRGTAGTGKTAVALHRVAWLASTRPGRFLVTSFVKTLPPVLEQSYRTLSPSTASRVDFTHLHKVALDLLDERGVTVVPDSGASAFDRAWRVHGRDVEGSGLTSRYFAEEISSVIKGRDLQTLESYLTLDRVGRRTPLREDARRQVWALKERYDAELLRRGKHDFADILRMARDEVRERPCNTWAGVVVDEVQDVPMVGLQLLHELAGRDRPDGLLLVGDGQQAIYPGGFRLAEAGVNVAGRAVVLRTNYRNTAEILASARSLVARDCYDDGDPLVESGDRAVEVVRHGTLPSMAPYASTDEHDQALLWDLQVLGSRGVPWSDVAVLCQTNDDAARYVRILTYAGVPAVLLASATALHADGVKVGTWFRSKGMEFPHVFLPQVNRTTMLLTGAGKPARAEKAELLRRTLYVAMTRARDTLWVGQVPTASSHPGRRSSDADAAVGRVPAQRERRAASFETA